MKKNVTGNLTLQGKKTVTLNLDQVRELGMKVRAIMHPDRIKIMRVLSAGECNVQDIYHELRMEQSVCSLHLKELRDAGILNVRKVGRNRQYSLDTQAIKALGEAADIA